MTSSALWIAGLLAGVTSASLHAQGSDSVDGRGRTAQDGLPIETSSEPSRPTASVVPQDIAKTPEPEGEPSTSDVKPEGNEQVETDSSDPSNADDEAILVTGERPRGSVASGIPPELTFSPLDIRSYGVNDIGALLQTLGPQVSSNRGRDDSSPVVLLNGKRVSNFTEIAKIPTEAIERMEVFPEELALRYGYQPDQKVVNVVTFERFASQVAQIGYGFSTEGGRETASISATFLRIRGETRYNLDVDFNRAGSLRESERDILQVSGGPDVGRFRTLLPESERYTLNATVSGVVLSNVAATLNGRFDADSRGSLLGFGVNEPVTRDADTETAHVGIALDGQAGKWLWSLTGNYDDIIIETVTGSGDALVTRGLAKSSSSLAEAELIFSGPLLNLPAGKAFASLGAEVAMRDFTGRSSYGVEGQTVLSRDLGGIQANLDIPLVSNRAEGPRWLGNLTANTNLAFEKLSDFGRLLKFGYGFSWSPVQSFNVFASVTNEESAPTVEQLGAPRIATPNVRTFDFVRGETVDIERIFGGNPDLRADDRRVFSLGVYTKPFEETDLTFSVDYARTRIDDPIVFFPIATAEIESALSERFTRDVEGRLQRIDGTPLNFERSQQQQLRSGVNFTRPLGEVPPLPPGTESMGTRFYPSAAAARAALPPGARMTTVAPGSPAAKRMESLASRLTLALYHTWTLEDEILVREGGPLLDLLNGSATGFRGGTSRHELDFQAGAFKGGLGARLTVNWRSGTTVRGLPVDPLSGGGTLRFSDYTSVNFSLFANLAEQFGGVAAPGWLKGTRASIGISNLLNGRPQVLDDEDSTPLNYQPAYLEPLGRVVSFSLRKIF